MHLIFKNQTEKRKHHFLIIIVKYSNEFKFKFNFKKLKTNNIITFELNLIFCLSSNVKTFTAMAHVIVYLNRNQINMVLLISSFI